MAKRKAVNGKRERPAERPILRDNPAGARDRQPDPLTEITTDAKAEFDKAHQEGMEALKRHDYEALSTAIRREQEVIKKVALAVESKRRK